MRKVQKDDKILCLNCSKPYSPSSYYTSKCSIAKDGRYPICKKCLHEKTSDPFDHETFKNIVNQMELPFFPENFIKALVDSNVGRKSPVLGMYMKAVNKKATARQGTSGREFALRDMQALDAIKEAYNGGDIDISGNDHSYYYRVGTDTFNDKAIAKIDQDERKKYQRWGTGFSIEEMDKMNDFYDKMCTSFVIETPTHFKMLEKLAKLDIMIDRAMQDGDTQAVKHLQDTFNKLNADGGFRPIDKISISEQAGIRSFSEIFAEVERDGFVEPYPLEENKDIIDKTIEVILNHYRKLNDFTELKEYDSSEDMPDEWDDDDE